MEMKEMVPMTKELAEKFMKAWKVREKESEANMHYYRGAQEGLRAMIAEMESPSEAEADTQPESGEKPAS